MRGEIHTLELANTARTTLHAVNTELGRLVKRGILRPYAQGWYGPARGWMSKVS